MLPSPARTRVLIGTVGTVALAAVSVAILAPEQPVAGSEAGDRDTLVAAADGNTDAEADPDDAEDPDADADAAMSALIADVDGARTSMTEPAFAGRDDAALLRLLLAEAVVGGDRDADRVSEQITEVAARLDDAADALDTAAATPPPSGPPELSSDSSEPFLVRLDALQEQSNNVATRLRTAADGAVVVSSAALDLHDAARHFADIDAERTDSSDPDVLAAAWAEDLERLTDYDDAARAAAEFAPLEAHAEAHLEVTAALTELAHTAVGHLEAGDVDAYNALLDDALTDPAHLLEELEPSLALSLDAVVSDAEAAEGRTLGLLSELDQLRAATPVRR
jgi:hypothetical protein